MEENKKLQKPDIDIYFNKVWPELQKCDVQTEAGKKEFSKIVLREILEMNFYLLQITDGLKELCEVYNEENESIRKYLEETDESLSKQIDILNEKMNRKYDSFTKLLNAQGELSKSASDSAKLVLEILMKRGKI